MKRCGCEYIGEREVCLQHRSSLHYLLEFFFHAITVNEQLQQQGKYILTYLMIKVWLILVKSRMVGAGD